MIETDKRMSEEEKAAQKVARIPPEREPFLIAEEEENADDEDEFDLDDPGVCFRINMENKNS